MTADRSLLLYLFGLASGAVACGMLLVLVTVAEVPLRRLTRWVKSGRA